MLGGVGSFLYLCWTKNNDNESKRVNDRRPRTNVWRTNKSHILVANGFEFKDSVRGYVYDVCDEDYSKYDFVIRPLRDLYYIPMLYSRVIDVHCVHELQHALRLCGLGELADNFKIE